MLVVVFIPLFLCSVPCKGTTYFAWDIGKEFYESLDLSEEVGGMKAYRFTIKLKKLPFHQMVFLSFCREEPICPFVCQKVIESQCNTFAFDEGTHQCSVGRIVANWTTNFIAAKTIGGRRQMVDTNVVRRNARKGDFFLQNLTVW